MNNYQAIVVKIDKTVPIEGRDFVHAAVILGNSVVVSKKIKEGDVGIYFPLECALDKEYLFHNNLYRNSDLNEDITKKGFFELNGRVRAQTFGGSRSEGLFMPLESLNYISEDIKVSVGDSFDTIKGTQICSKYINPNTLRRRQVQQARKPKESKIIDNQFRFHLDTSQLYKNLDKISPEDLIQITYKLHGTSGISSYVLCKKKLKWYEKLLWWTGVNVETSKYDYIYSSRRVIKNPDLNPNAQHYYEEDIWGKAHEAVKHALIPGMALYYEIVGYTNDGTYIQKPFDYGCSIGEFKVYVYRITMTNIEGHVYEYSGRQVQEYCKVKGLEPVPCLFYGYAKEFSDERMTEENWQNKFLETIKSLYNDKNCFMCVNKVPEEGVVIRKEGLHFEAYKQKSFKFYEYESVQLDRGESDIEEEN